MAGESMSAADYIKHHLQSLTSLSDVSKGQGLRNIADFSVVNLDSLFIAAFWRFSGRWQCGMPLARRRQGCRGVFKLL